MNGIGKYWSDGGLNVVKLVTKEVAIMLISTIAAMTVIGAVGTIANGTRLVAQATISTTRAVKTIETANRLTRV
ncbi:MAG: hypothetical protein LBI53_06285 [Candidatus Peribacteria bacterium]|jgi:hypothetical protein|nr:hypothetical protein [Candidatus Peribacteria bacterium]